MSYSHSDPRVSLALTASASTSAAIDYRQYRSGTLFIDGTSISTVTWYTKDSETGTAVAAYSGGTTPAAVTNDLSSISAAVGIAIPDALLGCPWIIPVLNTGTVTASASLKS